MKEITEEWFPVKGLEDIAECTRSGRIRTIDHYTTQSDKWGTQTNLYKGKELLGHKSHNGYLRVQINKKGYAKHRLIAETFIPNPDNLPQVNHKNEDKTDNRVENLEWVSCKDNINYGTRTERFIKTITDQNYKNKDRWRKSAIAQGDKVRCIETGKVYLTTWDAVRDLGFKSNHIYEQIRGDRSVACGYHWEYVA